MNPHECEFYLVSWDTPISEGSMRKDLLPAAITSFRKKIAQVSEECRDRVGCRKGFFSVALSGYHRQSNSIVVLDLYSEKIRG